MKKILLIGHSHTNCIYVELLNSYREQYEVERIHIAEVLKKMKEEKLECNLADAVIDVMEEKMASLNSDNKWFLSNKGGNINIILLFGGSFHNMLGLIKTDPAFDVICPNSINLGFDKDAELIPVNALKCMFKEDIDPNEELVSSIKKKYYSYNVFHLGFPPPLRDNNKIMENLETFFTIRHKSPVITSPSLRHKLWSIYLEMYCEMYARYKIAYIPLPKDMINNGFLYETAFADATHANNLYARNYIELFDAQLI